MKISDIVNLSQDSYMQELLPKSGINVTVECHDGSRETTFGLLAFVWSYFEFNRKYNVPVSVKQIPALGTVPSNKTHFKYINLGLNVVYTALDEKIPLNVISESGYDVLCNQINQAIVHLERYAMALDATDYYTLDRDPEVLAIRKVMREGVGKERTSAGKFGFVQSAYKAFADVVKRESFKRLRNNGMIQLLTSGTPKMTQVNQGVISRGFCSDVNSDFFAEPVLPSFGDGLNTLYEYALESCSGAKAAMYQKDPMSETEYLHRLVQMIAASFQHLHVGDCGSKVTYPFHIEGRHTPFVIGKYYMEGGSVKEVTKDNVESMVGKTLNFRMISGCKVADRNGACTTCCGANSLSLADGANLGHTGATRLMGTGSQKVLSVKHEDLASLSLSMMMSAQFKPYLELSSNNREVMLKRRDITLAIPEKCAEHIRYVYYVDDVKSLNITELSAVHHIELAENGDTGYGEVYEGPVGDKNEVVHLSTAFLEYIKEDHTRLVLQSYKRKRYYFVDLTDFPEDESIFLAPFKHFDMLIQHRLTKRFLYSPQAAAKDNVDRGPRLTDYETFGGAATALLELTMEKLGINLSVLEMAIYAFTVSDVNDYDYRPVRHSNICQFLPMEQLYNHRSLAAKLVSEKQLQVVKSPLAITNTKRSEHPFDGFHIDN